MKLFITGTDTNVGKTIITGLLGRHLEGKGCRVVSQKWLQTGKPPHDIETHLKLMQKTKAEFAAYLSAMSPYTFSFAASPHLAARMENRKISAAKIKQSFQILAENFEVVIVEGIGGALVPYNNKNYVLDIAKELRLPVLIVAANKLGAINHTMLTIEAIRQRKMPLIGIVFNQTKETDKRISADNPQIIKSLSGEKILGELPWEKNEELLYQEFIPIGDNIFRMLKLPAG